MTENYLLVDGAGTATEITGEIKIGRSKTNDLVLKDPLSSRHHATVYFEGEEIMVRDEQSVNGTVVNGTKIIGPTALKDQDKIQFGDEVFTVRAPLAESKTVKASDADMAAVEAVADDSGATVTGKPEVAAAASGEGLSEPDPPETKKDNKKTIIIVAAVVVALCLCCTASFVAWRYVIQPML